MTPLINLTGGDAKKVAEDLVGTCRGVAEKTMRDIERLPTPFVLIVLPGPLIDTLMLDPEPGVTLEEAAAELGDYMRQSGATAYAVIIGMMFEVEIRKHEDPDYKRSVASREGVMVTGQQDDRKPFCAVFPVERSPEGAFVALGKDEFAGALPVGLWSSLLYQTTRH